MKHILIDCGSVADILYLPALLRLRYMPDNLRNPKRVVVSFNRSQTHLLGEIVLLVSIGPIITFVPFTVIDDPSSFNAILGYTWVHAMKAFPSSYHQMLSFLTSHDQVDIRGD